MGGKAAILLVLGFSLIFLVMGHNFNNILNNSIDNSTKYYTEANAHNIAVSGANMAAAEIFAANENKWDAGFDNLPYNGGTLKVTVANPLTGTGDKITICHIPPGNPDARHTIEIPRRALQAHLNHGDFIGSCDGSTPPASDPKMIEILAEGTYSSYGYTVTELVTVKLLPSKFSKFAYFSAYEPSNIWWTSGDTVWGPMHVQGKLQVAYNPVFYGRVSTQRGLKYYTWRGWGDHPKFYGGYEQGINLPLPSNGVSDLKLEATNEGYVFSGQDTVIITFKADSINYKFSANDPTGTTVLTSSLTSNGTIFVDDGTLRISGTVSGRLTIGVDGSKHHGKGNVYFDDDVVYEEDPRINPNSNDLLGIVAQNAAIITDNYANNHDISIHGSVYIENGGFGAENHDSRPSSGNINLLGGIIQAERLAVGTFNSWGTSTGFNKRYKYDNRLMRISPPFFPGTDQYEIVSWYE